MGRMTRAKAAEVAERMHVDEDAVLELPSENDPVLEEKPATPEPANRAVLGEIAPNSAESAASVEIANKKTRSKRNGGKKADTVEEQPEIVEQEGEADVGEAQETGQDAGVEPEKDDDLEATTNETLERLAKMRITSVGNETASQAADRMSMNELQNEQAAAPTQEPSGSTPDETISARNRADVTGQPTDELPSITVAIQPETQEAEVADPEEETALEAPGSPIETATPKAIKNLRNETPGKRSTSNKENVEPVQPVEPVAPAETPSASTSQDVQPSTPSPDAATATQETSTLSSRRRSSDKAEDAIEAMDQLEEAVEKVNLEIPQIPASPEKQRTKEPAAGTEKPKKIKPAPVVRMTKAVQARLSMAQGGDKEASKTQNSARSRPSTAAGRPSTVRQSVVPASSMNRRITSTSSNANAEKSDPKPKKESVIPHSKPRPVSLSFPTPPPAARSSKAPTKSTFQLPGEAVAAKLKAAREERLKREATTAAAKTTTDKKDNAAAEKRPAFKARPAPNMLKKTPGVHQTAASRARESAMNGGPSTTAAPKPSSTSTAPPSSSLKRSNTIATSRPRPSTLAASKPTAPSQLTVTKRPRPSSVQIPASSAPRPSTSATRPGTSGNGSAAPRSASGTAKGKEVFSRAAAAKLAAETEKREKEEAARKARAAAAERGRAASREWAEKQKARKAAAASASAAPAAAA